MWKVSAKTDEQEDGLPFHLFHLASERTAMDVARQWAKDGLIVTLAFTPKVKK